MLTITAMVLFIVSCDQAAVNVPEQTSIEETQMLFSSHPLADVLANDQSFQDYYFNHLLGLDKEEQQQALIEYLTSTLFIKYPQLADMQLEEVFSIVAQSVLENSVDSRGYCHCLSGCHPCCVYAPMGAEDYCAEYWCPGYGVYCN